MLFYKEKYKKGSLCSACFLDFQLPNSHTKETSIIIIKGMWYWGNGEVGGGNKQ
jgi:hypothetical protein